MFLLWFFTNHLENLRRSCRDTNSTIKCDWLTHGHTRMYLWGWVKTIHPSPLHGWGYKNKYEKYQLVMYFLRKHITKPLIFIFSTAVTLKIRSRSPKSNQFFDQRKQMSPNCEFLSFSTAETLKIRSRSPKSTQFFVMSQLYIHENLVRIQPSVHKILCRQESVSPTSTVSAPKSIELITTLCA